MNTPLVETLKSTDGSVQSQTIYAYDYQAEGVAPTKGQVTQVRQGLDDLWAFTWTQYDAWGNPTVVTDTLHRATTTTYDMHSHQFPVSVTNAKGQTSITQWDLRLGVPVTMTDANGASTHAEYDSFGRVTAVIPPGDDAPAVKYTYPAYPISAPFAVKAETRVDAYAATPQYQASWTIYDGLGRAIQTQTEAEDGLLVLSDTTYDALGRPVMASLPYTVNSVSFPGGTYHEPDWNTLPKTVTDYDVKGRVITVTAADGSVTRKDYRAWSELLLDAKGHQTIYENDGLGRLIEVREYYGSYAAPDWEALDPAETTYTHDAAGNLVRVDDALGHVTLLDYDALGRKTWMDDPSMGQWSYAYDLAGNLVAQTDAEGQTLRFDYDALDRLVGKTADREWGTNTRMGRDASGSGPYSLLRTSYALLAEYSYDQGPNGIGWRTAMTDTTGTSAWQYDEQGRVVQETRSVDGVGTFETGVSYDAAGRVIATTLPTGETLHNSYNLRGLPESVTGLDAYLSDAAYNAMGQPLQQTWGNGLQTIYAYEAGTQRLERLQVSGGLLDLDYTYDRVGNLSTLTDGSNGGQVQTFAYDARDRLVSAWTTSTGDGVYSEGYGYDRMGNIITRTYGSKTVTYTYGRNRGLTLSEPTALEPSDHRIYLPLVARNYDLHRGGQPFAVVATSDGFRAGYDLNGNMLVRVEVSGTETITYTQEWNLENRLSVVTNTVSGNVTRFVYDGDGTRVLREDAGGLTANVGAVEVHISGTERTTTTYYFAGGQRIAMREGVTVTYLHGDHLGSASLATDEGGAQVSEMRYTPFGEIRYGDAPTDRRFTGQREESGIGLYDYGARFYSTSLGKFISADTIIPRSGNPQALNRYSYVINNPLRFNDPTGQWWEDPETGALMPGDSPFPPTPPDPLNHVNQLAEYAIYKGSIQATVPDEDIVSQYIRWVIYEARRYNLSNNQLAYVFATAHHESHWGYYSEELQGSSTYYAPYYGRGFVQLTHKYNYEKFTALYERHSKLPEEILAGSTHYSSKEVNLVMYPEMATDPQIAAQILVHGMYNGSFTGRKLSDYINATTVDFVGARAIIGKGLEEKIAQYAQEYAAILSEN